MGLKRLWVADCDGANHHAASHGYSSNQVDGRSSKVDAMHVLALQGWKFDGRLALCPGCVEATAPTK